MLIFQIAGWFSSCLQGPEPMVTPWICTPVRCSFLISVPRRQSTSASWRSLVPFPGVGARRHHSSSTRRRCSRVVWPCVLFHGPGLLTGDSRPRLVLLRRLPGPRSASLPSLLSLLDFPPVFPAPWSQSLARGLYSPRVCAPPAFSLICKGLSPFYF